MRRAAVRTFQPGDHVCAIYSGTAELAQIASDFVVQGLKKQERCWYVASGNEGPGGHSRDPEAPRHARWRGSLPYERTTVGCVPEVVPATS